jgi:5-methyltetrahydrofolate--homocysteine methyltransferase
MPAFHQALHSGRVLLMDGAMGTQLQRLGIGPNECGQCWSAERTAAVRAIHDSYVRAGAEVLLTSTFQTNPLPGNRFGQEDSLVEVNGNAVGLARAAAGEHRFVLGDIGPLIDPDTNEEFTDYEVLRQILTSLNGVDGFLFETCSSPRALSAVLFASQHNAQGEIPILLSLSYLPSPAGHLVTLSGHSPEWFAERAKDHRVTALGVNCGRDIDLDDMIEIIRRYRAVTDLPLFARPNAGTPTKQGDQWIYPHSPETMAARLPELLEAGANMIGGCCGTTPAHIAAFRAAIEKWNK